MKYRRLMAIVTSVVAFTTVGVAAASADVGAAATADPFACSFDAEFNATCTDGSPITTGEGSASALWGDGTILSLTKDAPTGAFLVAGATVNGFAGDPFFEAGFDVRGYCNNGAPRFNVYSGENTYFLGCGRGVQTPLEDGWTHVEFECIAYDEESSGGLPEEAEGACFSTISGIELIQDEGGTTALRNITVDGLPIGPPPPAEVGVPRDNRAGYCAPTAVPRPGQDPGAFL